MNLEREREVFEKWYLYHYYSRSGLNPDGDIFKKYHDGEDWTYLYDAVFRAWVVWQASANRQGYKLVPVNDINIADMIWGKCPCGSSRSPIVSDREGYNLIHCFACGANKYIHEDY